MRKYPPKAHISQHKDKNGYFSMSWYDIDSGKRVRRGLGRDWEAAKLALNTKNLELKEEWERRNKFKIEIVSVEPYLMRML